MPGLEEKRDRHNICPPTSFSIPLAGDFSLGYFRTLSDSTSSANRLLELVLPPMLTFSVCYHDIRYDPFVKNVE